MEPTSSFEEEITSCSQSKGKGKDNVKAFAMGGKNYSIEESKIVARCFVDVLEDPIIDFGQSVRTFWVRIAKATTERSHLGKGAQVGQSSEALVADPYISVEICQYCHQCGETLAERSDFGRHSGQVSTCSVSKKTKSFDCTTCTSWSWTT